MLLPQERFHLKKKNQSVLLAVEIYIPALCICQYRTLETYLVICRTARKQSSGKHIARKKEPSFQKEDSQRFVSGMDKREERERNLLAALPFYHCFAEKSQDKICQDPHSIFPYHVFAAATAAFLESFLLQI